MLRTQEIGYTGILPSVEACPDMQELSALLENEDLLEEMHGIKDENDLLRLAEKYNL